MNKYLLVFAITAAFLSPIAHADKTTSAGERYKLSSAQMGDHEHEHGHETKSKKEKKKDAHDDGHDHQHSEGDDNQKEKHKKDKS